MSPSRDYKHCISESPQLQRFLSKGGWFDCRTLGTPEMRVALTCHVQGGSQINHIFANRNAFDQAFYFKVARHQEFKSHSVVSVQLQPPKAEQMRRTLRRASYLPQLAPPATSPGFP